MTDLIGVPTNLSVRVSRKLTDGAYGSFEVSAELGVDVPPGALLDQVADGVDAWLTAFVAKSVHEKQEKIGSVAQHAQQAPVVQQEMTREPVVGDSETETFQVTGFLKEFMPDGKTPTLKAKGGKYSKFGVKVWPEMAAQLDYLKGWETWNTGDVALDPGIILTAIVLLDGGKAKKVIGWK